MSKNINSYAKFSRIFAFMTNSFVFLTIFLILTIFFTNQNKSLGNIFIWINLYLTLNLLFIILNGILFVKSGGDVGKVLSGISVKNGDGTFLSVRDYIFREFIGKFFSTVYFNLGYLYIFFNKKAQGFHDLLTESYVYVKSPIRVFVVFVISLVAFIVSLFLLLNNFATNKIFEKMGEHAQVLQSENQILQSENQSNFQ